MKPPILRALSGSLASPWLTPAARFFAPVRFGDVVELTSQVTEFRSSRFDVEHQLMVRGALAVEGRETRVWATGDAADPLRIKVLPVPEDVVARFQA